MFQPIPKVQIFDFTVILTSVSPWLRGRLKLPKKMEMQHIWTLAALVFVRFSDFREICSARTAPAGLHAHSSTHQAHTPWPGAVLFDLGPRSPRDHARLFQNRTFCVEIDPKSIYVDILGPHPDRPPPELVKNSRKSRKSQYFRYLSKLLRHGSSSNVTE